MSPLLNSTNSERFIYELKYEKDITSFFPARHSQGCLARVIFFRKFSKNSSTKPLKTSILLFSFMPQIVPCKQCRIKIPYTDLKPNAQGLWICQNCMKKSQKASAIQAEPQAVLTGKPLIMQEKQVPDYRYKCESCNYDLQASREMTGKMCPFCGQKGTLKSKKTSSDIIKEVSDWSM